MLTPAIRAIRYPSSSSTGRQPPHLVARKPQFLNEKPTRARVRRRKPVDWDRAQIGMRWSRVKRRRVHARVFQHRLHQLFIVSVILKGLHAAIELVGGIA